MKVHQIALFHIKFGRSHGTAQGVTEILLCLVFDGLGPTPQALIWHEIIYFDQFLSCLQLWRRAL
jgi:hypothetical protein